MASECLLVYVFSNIRWVLADMYEEVLHRPGLVYSESLYRRNAEKLVEQLSIRAPTWPLVHGCNAPLIYANSVYRGNRSDRSAVISYTWGIHNSSIGVHGL